MPALTGAAPSPPISAWLVICESATQRPPHAIHEGGIDRSLDTSSTSCASTLPGPMHTPPPSASTNSSCTTAIVFETDTDTADFSCPHCPRTSSHTSA
nr:unnamed protein product [Spirometra erinaceieuropaei]